MTRRLLFRYALGSTTGAGGIGAALAAAGAGAGAGVAEPPQLLHPLVQPVSQQVSQQDFLANIFDRRPRFLPQPLSQPQGSQALISHPQDGVLQLLQALISHPQVGAAPQPLPQPLSQQLSQPLPMFRTLLATLRSMFILACSTRPSSSSKGLRRGWQQLSQVAGPQPQAFISQPQLGAALAQGSQALISHPQDGPFNLPSKPQPFFAHGSQALISHPQLGAAAQPLSQHALSHPQPFRPSIRSNNPWPKDGVHRLAPSIRDPINMFHFIESQLPKR
ncbi:MAG: hypothetical protein U0930_23900 [Pirellulales bacterium]